MVGVEAALKAAEEQQQKQYDREVKYLAALSHNAGGIVLLERLDRLEQKTYRTLLGTDPVRYPGRAAGLLARVQTIKEIAAWIRSADAEAQLVEEEESAKARSRGQAQSP